MDAPESGGRIRWLLAAIAALFIEFWKRVKRAA